MKKILIIMICCGLWLSTLPSVEASEYLSYQSMRFRYPHQKLLHQYGEYDMNRMESKLGGRRFFGWQTHTEVQHQKVWFKKETLMLIVNHGETPIEQNFYIKQTEQSRVQFNTSGSIKLKAEGKIKTFDMGLDSSLNLSFSTDTTHFMEERNDIRLKVDPKTKVAVEIHGEGYVSNGVGAYYAFWRNTRRGGWEVFTVSTEYYSIVKEPV